jgi:catalase
MARKTATAILAAGWLAISYGAAFADEPSTAEQIIAVMNKVWGDHPATRANHAKGVVLEGVFTPSPTGKSLSKAPLFSAASVPVTVRYSDSTGVPNMPDGDPNANPHGMSIKFHLASGDDVDIVSNSLSFFPVATGEEFRDLLQAVIDSPAGAAKPTKVEQFFGAHPAAVAAFAALHTPTSFAREVYNGVDTFVFVAADGTKTNFRFKIVPEAGPEYLSPADAAKLPPNGLVDEIKQRVGAGQIKFTLQAQLAGPDDPINDATKPYPADRKLVDLGAITLTKTIPEDKSLSYLPLNLIDGIEPSADPLIQTRNDAYAISYGKRLQ